MKDIILYHGSRGGLDGPIRVGDRRTCDFGQGFYLGTNPMQAKGLVVEDACPVFYTIKLKLSEIPKDRILRLTGEDWICTILANRRRVEEFNQSEVASYWLDKMNQYDVIIGAIADDRMNEAMKRFSEYGLTDKGLMACLASVNYGEQYVLKTAFACSKTEILSEHELYGKEADDIRNYTQRMRIESRGIVNTMSKKYLRDGRYLNEMLQDLAMKNVQLKEEETDYER